MLHRKNDRPLLLSRNFKDLHSISRIFQDLKPLYGILNVLKNDENISKKISTFSRRQRNTVQSSGEN